VSDHTTKGELTESVGRTFAFEQTDIFSAPPASRRNDPITSKLAGKRSEDRISEGKPSKLHLQVMDAFRVNGPMTDETLENLPCFKGKYAPSTIRKRRSELAGAAPAWLVTYGHMTNSNGSLMTIWAVAP
jgi:hypothetical protein